MNQVSSDHLMGRKATPHLDLYASSLAVLCLLHCLAVPVLIALMPFASFYLADSHWLHQLIVLLAAPATFWVVYRGRPYPGFTTVAFGGLGLLVIAAFFEPVEAHEGLITVAGSIMLASAHLWRWFRRPVMRSDATPTTALSRSRRMNRSQSAM